MSDEIHLVVGASGGIGAALVRELTGRGKRVHAVNRSGKMDAPPGVELVQADAMDRASVLSACASVSVIYHCANVPYPEWERTLPMMMDNIVAGAARANAKLIVADNLYMYGPMATPMKEDSPYHATGHKGKLRARLANVLMQAHKSGNVRVAIGRASDFYGPRVLKSLMGEEVFRAVIAGKKAMVPCSLDAPHTMTFIQDFARGLALLAEGEEALGQIWHFGDAGALTGRQFLQIAFEEAGTEPNMGVYPPALIRLIGLFSPMIREVTENLYQYSQPFAVDSSKAMRAFGFQFTPHREGVKQTVVWYKKRYGNSLR